MSYSDDSAIDFRMIRVCWQKFGMTNSHRLPVAPTWQIAIKKDADGKVALARWQPNRILYPLPDVRSAHEACKCGLGPAFGARRRIKRVEPKFDAWILVSLDNQDSLRRWVDLRSVGVAVLCSFCMFAELYEVRLCLRHKRISAETKHRARYRDELPMEHEFFPVRRVCQSQRIFLRKALESNRGRRWALKPQWKAGAPRRSFRDR